jgi:hypothetical protein
MKCFAGAVKEGNLKLKEQTSQNEDQLRKEANNIRRSATNASTVSSNHSGINRAQSGEKSIQQNSNDNSDANAAEFIETYGVLGFIQSVIKNADKYDKSFRANVFEDDGLVRGMQIALGEIYANEKEKVAVFGNFDTYSKIKDRHNLLAYSYFHPVHQIESDLSGLLHSSNDSSQQSVEDLQRVSWRNLPLIPTLEELKDERLVGLPIVPSNKSEDKYTGEGGRSLGFKDFDDYLNTQTRLSREDMLGRARAGCSQFHKCEKFVDHRNMRMFKAHFVGMNCRLNYDLKSLRHTFNF